MSLLDSYGLLWHYQWDGLGLGGWCGWGCWCLVFGGWWGGGGRKMDKVSGHLVVENPSYFIILQYKLYTQLNKEYFVLRDFLILTVLILLNE